MPMATGISCQWEAETEEGIGTWRHQKFGIPQCLIWHFGQFTARLAHLKKVAFKKMNLENLI
jgi:hypothetical protein